MRLVSVAVAALLACAPLNAMATPLCDAVNHNLADAPYYFEHGVALPDAECGRTFSEKIRCSYEVDTGSRARTLARTLITDISACVSVAPVIGTREYATITVGTTQISVFHSAEGADSFVTVTFEVLGHDDDW